MPPTSGPTGQPLRQEVVDHGLPLPQEVVDREIERLDARRRLVFGAPAHADVARRATPGPPPTDPAERRVQELTDLFQATHERKPFGVALSGGGIRSATFNLGILEGLAQHGLLRYVDYLSTVSGGGYIGSWLHGVVRNGSGGDVTAASARLSPAANPVPAPPDTDPVSFLRKYSNYLAPRPGLFTADTWVIGLIWIRNVLLNQLILVPTVAACVIAVLLAGFLRQTVRAVPWAALAAWRDGVALVLALGALAAAEWIIARNLRVVVRQSSEGARRPAEPPTPVRVTEPERRAERLSALVAPCVFVAALLIGCSSWAGLSWSGGPRIRFALLAVGVLVLLFRFQWEGGFRWAFGSRHEGRSGALAVLHVLWMVPVTAAFALTLLYGATAALEVAQTSPRLAPLFPWISVTLAPPLVCLSLVLGIGLLVGLMGADYPDGAREWIIRIGAMLALLCAAWMAVFFLTVFGPWAVAAVLERYTATGVAAIGGFIATVAGGVLAGCSARTSGSERPVGQRSTATSGLTLLTNVAPTVFMVGYLLLIATLVHGALPRPLPAAGAAPATPRLAATYDVDVTTSAGDAKVRVDVRRPPLAGWVARVIARAAAFRAGYWSRLSVDSAGGAAPGRLLALLAVCLLVTAVASSRININEFSIHHFYRNRLVRCYLGASQGARRDGAPRAPNPLTGFDPADDFRLATLVPDQGYAGPYAIVNTTLNLNAGSELARQERKAASFVFTPDFCGFAPSVTKDDQDKARRQGLDATGYRRTEGYSHPDGPTLGTALAISGAAASPNWGYHTSGPMAFLLTVFDVRLGAWLGNPRRARQSRYAGPVFAWRYLIAELLAQTTARSKFVNLSDGGHFDNLGLYELVRRRCRYVVVGDGEEDGRLTFASLGGAIRKCRADFGVEIDIDPRPIRRDAGFSGAHCVVGTITYPEHETGPDGRPRRARGCLLYLKASLTGDEPADVIEYHSRFPEFPHQSTVDQFFTESQFESYRRLGLHVARDAFESVPPVPEPGSPAGPADLATTFEALDRKWYAPIPTTQERASRLADDYAALVSALTERAEVAALADELFDRSPGRPAPAPPPSLATVAAALRVLQLMENVFAEFGFEHPASRENPRNAGWMRLFTRWARSSILYDQVWPHVRNDYEAGFQRFMETLRAGDVHSSWAARTARP